MSSVRELRDGSILVSDQADDRLVHVTLDPQTVRAVGRAGDGPAEYRRAGWLYPLGGDSSVFTDSYTARWLILDGPRIISTIPEHGAPNRALGAQLSGSDRRGRVLGVAGATAPEGTALPRRRADSLVLLMARPGHDRMDTIGLLKGRGGSALRELARPALGGPRVVVLGNPLDAEDPVHLRLQ